MKYKKEFHYLTSGQPLEYSLKFEIMSILGRTFFNNPPPLRNGYCNLGCGHRYINGYVNADFYQFQNLRKFLKKSVLPKKPDWELDIRKDLKCNEDFFSGVLLEHVIEHITIHDCLLFLKRLRKIIKKKGLIRISVPNLQTYIDFYNKKKVHPKFNHWASLRGEAIWSLCHNFGHKSVYDYQFLKNLLEKSGYKNIRRSSCNKSKDPKLRIDDIGRKWESLYVEASK